MANAFILEPLPFQAVPTGTTAAGYDVANMNGDYRGVIWRSVTGNATYWVVDLGADTIVDTVMLFGLWGNFNPATAVMSIVTATDAQGPTFGGESTTTGTGVGNYYRFPTLSGLLDGAPIAARNGVFLWRRPAADPSPIAVRYIYLNPFVMGALGWIDVARLVIGHRIELERNFSFGASFGVKDLGSLEFSRRGVLLRNRGAKLRTTSLTFSNMRKDEVEAQTKPLLERIGNTECVAIVTDPAPDAQRQNRCYFGPLVGDLGHTWRRAGAWEAKANLVSIF